MTPEITIRTFTDDQYVLDKIFYANNYRLKTFPEDKPITIVDVGAHTGYFSLLCLLRGAHAVYSVEPFSDNFRILIGNLEAFNERLTALKMGVYTESKFANITYPEPENSFFYLSHINFHDGVSKGPREMASFCTLDNLLNSVNEEEVTILKIHIGYAEAEILLSSERLDKCEYVCGETEASSEKLEELVAYMSDKGFGDSFLAESKEKKGTHLFIFAKDKCENLFNLYASGSPEDLQQGEAARMTQVPPE